MCTIGVNPLKRSQSFRIYASITHRTARIKLPVEEAQLAGEAGNPGKEQTESCIYLWEYSQKPAEHPQRRQKLQT